MGRLNKIIRTTVDAFSSIINGTHATHTYDDNNLYIAEMDDPVVVGTDGSGMHVNDSNELVLDNTIMKPIKTVMDSVAVVNTRYFLGEQTAVNITMPTTGLSLGDDILVCFSSGTTACTLSCDLEGFDFVPKAEMVSWLMFTYVATDKWICDAREG